MIDSHNNIRYNEANKQHILYLHTSPVGLYVFFFFLIASVIETYDIISILSPSRYNIILWDANFCFFFSRSQI